jgi:HlyD family secretion protein
MQERMASMTPEEREQFMQRLRDRGIDSQNPGGPPGPGGGQGPAAAGGQGPGPRAPLRAPAAGQPGGSRSIAGSNAQTIDSLFGPLPVTETAGRVWLFVGGELKPVRVRLGITDGTYTELISGDLQEGAELVSSVTLAAQAASSAAGRSPLMGPSRPPGGGPPPGGFGGGGAGGGAPSGGSRGTGR